jgi:hypothetical protein
MIDADLDLRFALAEQLSEEIFVRAGKVGSPLVRTRYQTRGTQGSLPIRYDGDTEDRHQSLKAACSHRFFPLEHTGPTPQFNGFNDY